MAAPTFGRVAATQLTASGTGTALDVSGAARKSLYIRHSNGTGAVTAVGTVAVQVKPSGGTFITAVQFSLSPTATAADYIVYELPDDCVSVQCVYVQPTGTTGQTLDNEAGTVV
jgi:hypothetical protein